MAFFDRMSGEPENSDRPESPPKKLAVEPRPFRVSKDVEPLGVVLGEDEAPRVVPRLEMIETKQGKFSSRFETNGKLNPVAHVKPKFQPRGEEPDATQVVVAGWGKTGKRSFRWAILAGVGVLIVIIGGLAIQPLLVDEATQPSELEGLQVVEDVVNDASPTRYFEENADQVARELYATLMAYARARSFEEILPLVRDGDRLKLRLIDAWRPWEAPPNWKAPDASAMGYGSVGDRPYAFMKGVKPNFEPFRMFFVRENGKMLIDWEATEGVGSHTLEELKNPALKEATMRVVASPAMYYTASYNEERYRAFQLVGIDGESYVWGYAGLGTPAEETLTRIFSGGVILNDRTFTQAVRVRLTRGPEPDGLPNQWLILDVLHKGWVAP